MFPDRRKILERIKKATVAVAYLNTADEDIHMKFEGVNTMRLKVLGYIFLLASICWLLCGCLMQAQKSESPPAAPETKVVAQEHKKEISVAASTESAKPGPKKTSLPEAEAKALLIPEAPIIEHPPAPEAKAIYAPPPEAKATLKLEVLEKSITEREAPVKSQPKPELRVSMPAFPWPPPRYSAIANIPIEFIGYKIKSPTLGDVAIKLESALENAGYSERSYYYILNGFALITRIERIDVDGRPFTDDNRWIIGFRPMETFSLASYIKALFIATPGHYRVIVFAITDRPFAPSSKKADSKEFSELLLSGQNTLPKEIAKLQYSSMYRCTALIYEFIQKATTKTPSYVYPSNLTGKLHLTRARILEGLK